MNNDNATQPARLRALLAQPGLITSLGVHDVFTGLVVEQAGFDTVFLGGFGASASALGLPDLNLMTMSEMAEVVGRMTARLTTPVIADGDTGHGDLHNVARTVAMFERAGAAGILLEDQVTPKRCGHFADKQVIPAADMVLKIKVAVQTRRNPDFVIIARTDARQVNGLDDAIDRANRCCAAGADVAFIEAPQSLAELAEIPRRVPYPLLANMLTGGVTPILPAAELAQLGYKIAVFPVETLMVTAAAVRALCAHIQATGRADTTPVPMATFADIKQLLGVEYYLSMREQVEEAGKY